MGQTIKWGRGGGELMPLISSLGSLTVVPCSSAVWGLGDKGREV